MRVCVRVRVCACVCVRVRVCVCVCVCRRRVGVGGTLYNGLFGPTVRVFYSSSFSHLVF